MKLTGEWIQEYIDKLNQFCNGSDKWTIDDMQPNNIRETCPHNKYIEKGLCRYYCAPLITEYKAELVKYEKSIEQSETLKVVNAINDLVENQTQLISSLVERQTQLISSLVESQEQLINLLKNNMKKTS